MTIQASLKQIPVDVTLEFGTATSTLGALNALAQNAIVPIDAPSDAPVKLCLNHQVIALGTLHHNEDTGKIFLRVRELPSQEAKP